MKTFRTALAVLFPLTGARTFAAEIALATSTIREEKPVQLSPFEIRDSSVNLGRHTSLESTSVDRVRTDIMDSSQSISVITEELIEDVAPGRILDVAKYVAGVSDSTLPTSWERINIRGFEGQGRTVDGISYSGTSGITYGFQNIDPAIIDRIEIVKGPNSVLAPEPTSAGGTINNATKKPQFRNFGLLGARVGRFDANSAFLDVNRVVNDKFAARFVGSERHWDNYWKGSRLHSTTWLPSLTYRFSPGAAATVQYVHTNWKASNYFGLPLDPTSGSTTRARILDGVPRDLDIYPDDIYRATRQHEFKLFFTANLWHGIQLRVVAAQVTNVGYNSQLNTGPSIGGAGGNVDPLTGLWNPGVSYASTPPYAPSPLATRPTRFFNRGIAEQFPQSRQFDLQNDYAYVLEHRFLRATTVAGFAYRDRHSGNSSPFSPATPFDIDHYVDTPLPHRPRPASVAISTSRFRQGYVSEKLALFKNRLLLNAAETWQTFPRSDGNINKQLHAFGAVLKPAGEMISLYCGHTEKSSDATARPDPARQTEFGARVKTWNGKLYFTVAHFDLRQDNFSVINPRRLEVPTPSPLPPTLLYWDRKSKGWEYELRANPTKSLSILGNYTHFKNRDPNNVEARGVAEKSGGVLASYAFNQENISSLTGLRIAIGADHLGKRPGDVATGLTAAGVPIQPSFYLDARTLVNLTLAYNASRHWGVQANVDNVFDTEYLMTGVTRTMVFPGTPRNLRVTLKYGF